MKKLTYIALTIVLLFSIKSIAHTNGQSIPVSPVSFGTAADIRLQAGTSDVPVKLLGITTKNDGNGGDYMWSATSTATDDGFTTFQVTGVATGRWLRILNPNTLKGNVILSGTAFQTAYNITFGQTLPSIPAMVIVQAYSNNAAQVNWITNVTTTGFTLNFQSVPILGTNNLNVYWLVIKQ